eukprot:c26306_g1_i1.p1 GENE.c26306_g1_i1~~c26306_g1_i1.p1  ORF type:complete len:132 (-),score=23.31 c26306_g1_i1:4-399(-)
MLFRYLGRIVHMLCGGVMIGLAADPFIRKDTGPLPPVDPRLAITVVILILVSGLYNLGELKPSKLGAAAGPYRAMIYGGKGLMFVLASPLLKRFCPAELYDYAFAGVVVAAVCIGTFARFYREASVSLHID